MIRIKGVQTQIPGMEMCAENALKCNISLFEMKYADEHKTTTWNALKKLKPFDTPKTTF